ncbi:tripartite tricarboxylate transporter substrate-binding protein [Plastoroseomonas arctica]|uniref:Tripartite tricarboxylate transporter substrate binding protein BugD n=1 Tax=Plastoroseomonas arctica TaxID=1509237 RepID=A0AAF1K4Z4_9PROT|nr:tripartite tricarboxylate transporter substrate-binding protein [Plastoroseomonas arctica]MBR0655850.1 tripartite tricarboxylate transporter substrate binding protein BugD [Plastoroseomonas arctica]
MLRRAAIAAIPLALVALHALAQPYPSRPITIVAAGAAGGPTDTIARITAEALGRQLNNTVVVEAIGGSTTGPARVALARPDGYTLLINNIGLASQATLYRRLSYNPLTSFAPLGLVSDAAMTVVARTDFPAEDMRGAMADLRQRGDAVNFAAAGLGSAANLCALLVQGAAGTQATMVNFRGTAPAIAELMAGRVDLLCDQATNTVSFIRDGRVRALSVSSPARLPGLPTIPTTAEAGFPTIAMSTWHGFYAPAGTPEPIQERLSAALRGAMADPALRRRFADLLTDPATEERATIAFHRAFLAEEVARWRPVIEASGAYAD